MGLSPSILSIFHKLAQDGALKEVGRVVELGAQTVSNCEDHAEAVRQICLALGRDAPALADLDRIVKNGQPAGPLYELFGIEYQSIDTSGEHGALTLDINFDEAPEEHRGRYGMTTNLGTTEHLLNQLNAFTLVHDLTRAGGLMLHQVPFHGHVDHGFFNYQPCLFESLARFNSYEILGMWLHISGTKSVNIPWEPGLMDDLRLPQNGRLALAALLRKMNDAAFCIPFQGRYEMQQDAAAMARYFYNIDGELVNGRRNHYVTSKGSKLQEIPGRALARELLRRIRIRIFGPG